LLEGTNTRGECGSGCLHGFSTFDFGDEGGADYGGVRETTEDGNVAGEGDAEAYGDGELRDGASTANERGEIVR
jgi:hypothetical protein